MYPSFSPLFTEFLMISNCEKISNKNRSVLLLAFPWAAGCLAFLSGAFWAAGAAFPLATRDFILLINFRVCGES